MAWNKIMINYSNIVDKFDKTFKIKMPNNSKYNGYTFLHPKKLIRQEGGKGTWLSLSYTDEWEFVLKKFGKGQYNKYKTIDEVKLTSKDFFKAWEVTSDNIESSKKMNEESYLIVEEPEKIEVQVRVLDEFKN